MYKSNRLFDEFIDIERDINTGKIDHSPNYHKDALDAVCGATFNASKDADQFAYEYGETLETTLEVNSYEDSTQEIKNLAQSMLGSLQVKNPKTGKIEPTQAMIADEFDSYLGTASDGILYW